MRQSEYDALVLGAGPAGSAAAILLASAGWSVALIEQQSFPRRKVCGECIAATNLPLLDVLGVGPQFRDLAGAELRSVALFCGRQSLRAAMPSARTLPYAWGRALGREQLDVLLLERARELGVCVWQPWTAGPLHGGPGEFRCELRSLADEPPGRTMSIGAAVAIEARGSWSARAGAARADDLLAFKANYSGTQLEPGVLPVIAFRGGYGGMVLADGGLLTLACCIQARWLRACRHRWPAERAGSAIEQYLRTECRGVRDALHGATRRGPWLAVGPVRPGIHLDRRVRAPGAFAVGNAAGEAHPLVGEGISMALQSAWLLAAELLACPPVRQRGAEARASQALVHRRYARAWHRQFAARTRHAAWLAQLAMRPALLRPLFPLLRRVPALLTHSARWSGKVHHAPTASAPASPSAGMAVILPNRSLAAVGPEDPS